MLINLSSYNCICMYVCMYVLIDAVCEELVFAAASNTSTAGSLAR